MWKQEGRPGIMGKGTRQWEGDTRKCERDEVRYKVRGGEKDDLRGGGGGDTTEEEGALRRRRGEGL